MRTRHRGRPVRSSARGSRAFSRRGTSRSAAGRRAPRRTPTSSACSTPGSGTTRSGFCSGRTTARSCRSRRSAARRRTGFASARSTPRRSGADGLCERDHGSPVDAAARERPPLLLPLHRPRRTDLQQDLPRDRVRVRVRRGRDRVRAHRLLIRGLSVPTARASLALSIDGALTLRRVAEVARGWGLVRFGTPVLETRRGLDTRAARWARRCPARSRSVDVRAGCCRACAAAVGSRFVSAVSSASISTGRVRRGSITSST